MIKRYNGDCLELVDLLEDNSIQLVMTSPPYFNSEKRYQRVVVFIIQYQ